MCFLRRLFKKKMVVDVKIFEPIEYVPILKICEEIHTLINEIRKENNLRQLLSEQEHTVLAMSRVDKFIIKNLKEELFHIDFFGNDDYLTNQGVNSVYENIAYGYSTAQAVVNAWMKSDSHRKIILNPYLFYTGIYAEKDLENRYYYCQIFGN